MIRWFRQYWAIAKNAFVVTLSDPVYLVLMLSVLALMLIFACLPTFNFGEGLRLVRDQSLALTFIGGCILAVSGVATVIVRDMRQGAVSVLMSRPVSSASFVFGKWTGIAGAILVYHITVSLACLWVTRIAAGVTSEDQRLDMTALGLYLGIIVLALFVMALKHYFLGGWYVWQASAALCVAFIVGFLILGLLPTWHGGGVHSFDGKPLPDATVDWPTSQACLMLLFGELIFSALLMPIAVETEVIMLLAGGVILFFLGLLSQSAMTMLLGQKPGVIGGLVKALVPNWQLFWISDFLADSGKWLAPSYVGSTLVHTLAYAGICLVLATMLFNRREFSGHDVV